MTETWTRIPSEAEIKIEINNLEERQLRCVICFETIQGEGITEEQSEKSSSDQLRDLLRVFQVCPPNLDQLIEDTTDCISASIPDGKIFCTDCAQRIFYGQEILGQIESLQLELKLLAKILYDNVLTTQNWEQSPAVADGVFTVRRTLVQCFAQFQLSVPDTDSRECTPGRSKHVIGKVEAEPEEDPEDSSLHPEDDEFLSILRPETILSSEDAHSSTTASGKRRGATSTLWSDEDDGYDDPLKLGSFPTPKKKRKLSEINLTTVIGNRIYDNKGKVVSYDCPYCKQWISRDDYVTRKGDYVFRCSPSCCNKIISTFSNLVNHHEAYCPSKPRQTKYKRKHKKKYKRLNPQPDRVYDDKGRVIAFECPHCQLTMSKSDYISNARTGQYLFQCNWENCGKVTDNFSNLTTHHSFHCIRSGGSGTGCEFDDRGRVSSFECPYCQLVLSQRDFLKPGSVQYNFSCSIGDCKVSPISFSHLVSHHKTHCMPKRSTNPSFNKEGKLESFHCTICEQTVINNNESSSGETACPVPSCDQILPSFAEFRTHHETHCTLACVDSPIKSSVLMPDDDNDPPVRPVLPDRIFPCRNCDKEFHEEHQLKTHASSCKKTVSCLTCAQQFTSNLDLSRHLKVHDEPDEMFVIEKLEIVYPITCHRCAEQLGSEEEWKEHKKQHLDEVVQDGVQVEEVNTKSSSPLPCPTCGDIFATSELLEDHVMLQDVECSYCDRMFKSKHDLHIHIQRIHPNQESPS